MKNIFLTLLLIISISCKAQIVDVNTSPLRMTQGGYYAKDSNNEFDPFLGTWEATWNNKKITLYLSKVTHHYVDDVILGYYYTDFVIGKYKVVDLSTGTALEDTTSITNIDNMPIESTVLIRNKNLLKFIYSKGASTSSDCDLIAYVLLYRDINNPNILTYKYFIDSYEDRGCPYTNVDDIPVNIPKQEVILHKL